MGLNNVGVVGEKYLVLCKRLALSKSNDVMDDDITGMQPLHPYFPSTPTDHLPISLDQPSLQKPDQQSNHYGRIQTDSRLWFGYAQITNKDKNGLKLNQ